jgi:hypothetical protein
MITIYENLMKRADDLRRVENYCQDRGKQSMAAIWRKQRTDMEKIAGSLTAKEAGQVYNQAEHIGGVITRNSHK